MKRLSDNALAALERILRSPSRSIPKNSLSPHTLQSLLRKGLVVVRGNEVTDSSTGVMSYGKEAQRRRT